LSGQTFSFATDAPQICVLRLSAIGDVCHAVSMVQQMQRRWPKASITWVIGKTELSLLHGLAGVDFVVFDKSAGVKAYLNLRNRLKYKKFDVLLHMQVALRSSLASLCISAQKKIGFDRSRAKECQWLFSHLPIEAQTHPHVLDGFQAFAAAIGVEKAPPRWQMPLENSVQEWADDLLCDVMPFVVIVPAASNKQRNWLADRYAQVADMLIGKGFQVVLCGGPVDVERDLAQQIQQHTQSKLLDMVGKTSLKQLLAILRNASFVISPDTGPAHMAVTVGTPVIGLYAHSNPRRTGPYLYQDYVVSAYDEVIKEQFGRPWISLPWGLRAKGEGLMAKIGVEHVREKVEALIRDCRMDNRE